MRRTYVFIPRGVELREELVGDPGGPGMNPPAVDYAVEGAGAGPLVLKRADPRIPPGLESFLDETLELDAPRLHVIEASPNGTASGEFQALPGILVHARRLDGLPRLNQLFRSVNRALPVGGLFAFRAQTRRQRKLALRRKLEWLPSPLFKLVYGVDFFFHRLLPRTPGLRTLYLAFTGGWEGALSKTEILGRAVYCGFQIVDTSNAKDVTYVLARKATEPEDGPPPSYGPVCTIPRVGRHGKIIQVHKLRTMYPYAEFIQEYVYQQNALANNGKFKRDFRVTRWGRILRRFWLDELPMVVNWLKGDLKLVGVRPLTRQYLSLYDEGFREYRQGFKPGLVPPYYADLPDSLEEIMASEEAYLRAYERRPFRTDLRYLARAARNILLGGARSG